MTTNDSGSVDQLGVGCPVFTADGHKLGQVKEVRGRYFKVDAPWAPDYWLSRDTVSAVQDAGVTLTMDKDHIGDAKVDEPDDAADEANQEAVEAIPSQPPVATDVLVPTSEAAASAGSGFAHEGLLTAYPPMAPVAPAMHEDPMPLQPAMPVAGGTLTPPQPVVPSAYTATPAATTGLTNPTVPNPSTQGAASQRSTIEDDRTGNPDRA